MAKRSDAWGIEVGAYAVKAVRLVRTGAEVRLADYVILPFKKVLTTPDINVEDEIKAKLEELKAQKELRKSKIVISVPGHMAFARFAKLPPVEPKQIPNIVRFEAQQQIPFKIDLVEWDYHVFMRPDSPDVEVGIFAITKERINQHLKVFKDLRINVDGVNLSPMAVYNAVCYDQELKPDSPGQIFLDIGTTATDMIFVEGGRIWLRTLPIGGNQFTDALVRSFKLSFSKAEKLKAEAATSKYSRQIFQAMRPIFADLVQEMQRSMGFYQTINRDAKLEKLVGLGSTFRLPGLQKFLKQQLQMEVTRPDSFKRITSEDKQASQFSEDVLNLHTAYGLALQGIDMEAVDANLVPAQIIKQRLWRAKQPWFAGAAAVVAVSVGASAANLWKVQSSYAAKAAASNGTIDGAIKLANVSIQTWKGIEGGVDPRAKVENLRRIMDYRDVWPKVMHDLELAVRSLDPQEALLDPSRYGEAAGIPREQRRKIVIESVSTEYRFTGATIGGTAGPAPGTMTADQIWGERKVVDPAEKDKAVVPLTPEALAAKTRPPSFVITIKGTTPFAEAPRFLSQTLIRWLQDNAERPGRPYKFVVGKDALVDVFTVGGIVLTPAGGGAGTPAAAAGAPRPRPGQRNVGGPVREEPRPSDGLYPARPLKSEPTNRDWRYEIRWYVQLVRPEDARLAEDDSHSNAASNTGDAAATQPATTPEAQP
jgi:type IV pilus assembly protein PilM